MMAAFLTITVLALFCGSSQALPSGVIPGGHFEFNADNPMAKSALEAALNTVRSSSVGLKNEHVLITKVNRVVAQVVEGMKYDFELEGKGEQSGTLYSCQMSVVAVAWRQQTDVVHFSCQPQTRTKRSAEMNGEKVDIESQPQLKKLFEEAINEDVNKNLEGEYLKKVTNFPMVVKEDSQGTRYKVYAVVSETTCKVGTTSQLTGCPVDQHQLRYLCVYEMNLNSNLEVEASADKCVPMIWYHSLEKEPVVELRERTPVGRRQELDLATHQALVDQLASSINKKLAAQSTGSSLVQVVGVRGVTLQVMKGAVYEVTVEQADVAVRQQGHRLCKYQVTFAPHGSDEVTLLECSRL